MSPEERNEMWESAAAQLGLTVVAEASKLRRRRNRVEGVIDDVPVAVSYLGVDIDVSLTVRDVPYSNATGESVMHIFALGDPTDSSLIVTATREALAAFHSLSSAPPVSRQVGIEHGGAVKLEDWEAPQPVEILGALGAMGSGSDEEGFIILEDNSNSDFMQSARGDGDFIVEYHDGSADQLFTTTVTTLKEALELNLLWLANDQAWTTAVAWTPVDL